jgi:hypothetical protein
MQILEAILVAEAAIKLGSEFVELLKSQDSKTISRKQLEKLLSLPSFVDILKEKTEASTDG